MEEKETNKQTKAPNALMKALNKIGNFFVVVGKTLWRWLSRAFFGNKRELSKMERLSVEEIESPTKQIVKAFLHRKLAMASLITFLGIFLFVFIGSIFVPIDNNFSDTRIQNLRPGFNQLSISKRLSDEGVKSITSVSSFSVGLSKEGTIDVWGATKIGKSLNVADIPEEIRKEKVAFAAAGKGHIMTISASGKVQGWGESDNYQLKGKNYNPPATVDVSTVKNLYAGYDSNVILYNDGTCFGWGSDNTITNIEDVRTLTDVRKIVITDKDAVAITSDKKFAVDKIGGSPRVGSYRDWHIIEDGTHLSSDDFLTRYAIEDMSSDGPNIMAVVTLRSDPNVYKMAYSGVCKYKEDVLPVLEEGEHFLKLSGGLSHYVALTNKGRVKAWGSSNFNLHKSPNGVYEVSETEVYAGSYQSYVVQSGRVVAKWGLSGFLMGTDEQGRSVFARIVHGGRMTLTVGAVAVIISSIIGIIIGVISGYFGGWVDILLMRIAEIVSAIPFLPFAMLLSIIISSHPIDELTRIIIIMVILGVLSWPGLAHLIRGQVLAEREKEFVLAAKAMGVKESRIAFRHILPNIVSIIIVSMTLSFAGCMLTESSLSYLGFGVKAPRPTWGNMLYGASSSEVIQTYWWRWFWPSVFLALACICINIIGDNIRDILDPRSSQER